MAESSARPKPAAGNVADLRPPRMLLVAGGEESGHTDEAVPAVVVRGREIGPDDPRGREEGTAVADVVVFNSSGSAATPYTDVPVFGTKDSAQDWLDNAGAPQRDPATVSPARRVLVAFWPSR